MWTSSSSPSSLNPTLPIQQLWDETILPSHLRRTSAAAGLILQDFFPKDPPLAARPHDHQPPPPALMISADGSGKRRSPDSEIFPGDRSHKRIMKNRVSAARSRARKQAYTYELESQVAFLREQNSILKKQQQQEEVCINASDRYEGKKFLYRTSSAPF